MIGTLLMLLVAVVGAINLVVYGCIVLASRSDEEIHLLRCQCAPPQKGGTHFVWRKTGT